MGVDLDGCRTVLYRMYDADGALLYVGITNNMRRRWIAHKRDKWWIDEVDDVVTEHYESRHEASIAEQKAIRSERPRHNDMLAVVSPNNRSSEPQALRVVLGGIDSHTMAADSGLRAIIERHPGDTLVECQAGRAVTPMGRVTLTDASLHEFDKFCSQRRVRYGIVEGITGSPIRKPHVHAFFDMNATLEAAAERAARVALTEKAKRQSRQAVADAAEMDRFASEVGLIFDASGWLPSALVAEMYRDWCQSTGQWHVGGNRLAGKLRARGCKPKKRKNVRGWSGVST